MIIAYSLLSSYCRCFIFYNFRIFHINWILTEMSHIAFCFSSEWSLFDSIKPASRAWISIFERCPKSNRLPVVNWALSFLQPILPTRFWKPINLIDVTVLRCYLFAIKIKWHGFHSCDIIDFRSLNVGKLTNADFSF